MAKNKLERLDTSNPTETFKEFLNLPDNERIIFSGVFGIGKTTFLKEYFKDDADYLAIHIFPINYSVAKNEDVFELIKYDIFYRILELQPSLEKFETTSLDALYFLEVKELYMIFKHFVDAIPEIGEKTLKIIKPLEELSKALNSKKNKTKTDEGEQIKKFGEKLEDAKGSIYESDFYTELIIKLINEVRIERNKKVVLIIDDLDRTDPDHIFRILNIFASHFDSNKDGLKNKFDFDRIILSCDIENVKSIFFHRYGNNVDFGGYIDKFYSKEIFRFENQSVILDALHRFVMSIRIVDVSNPVFQNNGNVDQFLTQFLYSMYLSGTLNLRLINQFFGERLWLGHKISMFGNEGFNNKKLWVIQIFDFLIKIFDNPISLRSKLEATYFSPVANSNFIGCKSLIEQLVFIAGHKEHGFREGVDNSLNLGSYTYVYAIVSNAERFGRQYLCNLKQLTISNSGFVLIGQRTAEDVRFSYKELFLTAFNTYVNGLTHFSE